MMKILIISAHPDDETLGCGGTILKHKQNKDIISWMITTKPYKPKWSSGILKKKEKEIQHVSNAYGMKDVFNLGFPATNLSSINLNDLIDKTREVLIRTNPNIVYLVNKSDVHSDHQFTFQAVMTVLKPFYMEKFGVQRILCYETLSSTEAAPAQEHRNFIPTIYSDVTPYTEQKIQIMSLYKTEIHDDPLPRGPSSIRALARHRGATIGVEYAEAFMLIREVI